MRASVAPLLVVAVATVVVVAVVSGSAPVELNYDLSKLSVHEPQKFLTGSTTIVAEEELGRAHEQLKDSLAAKTL